MTSFSIPELCETFESVQFSVCDNFSWETSGRQAPEKLGDKLETSCETRETKPREGRHTTKKEDKLGDKLGNRKQGLGKAKWETRWETS